MLKRLLKIVLLASAALVAALALLLWLGARDLPGYDDRGIPDIAARAPGSGFNAYDHLKYLDEAGFAFELTAHESRALYENRRLDEWELGNLVAVLKRNERYIRSFIYASDQAYFKQPVNPGGGLPATSTGHYYTLAYLTMFKSRLLAASGNFGPAVDHGLAVLRFSELLLHDYGGAPLLLHAMGSVMQADALDFLQSLVVEQAPGREHIERIANAVGVLPSYADDGYERVLAREYLALIALQEAMLGGSIRERWVPYSELAGGFDDPRAAPGAWSFHLERMLRVVAPGYLFHSNRAFGEYARLYAGFISASHEPCATLRMPQATEADRSGLWRQLGPNGAGTVTQQDVDGHLGFFMRRCFLHSSREAMNAFLANAVYERDQGTYANELADLVPRYLGELPRDAFSGAALRQSSDGALIYSVGSDGLDGGGDKALAAMGRVACARDRACMENPTFFLTAAAVTQDPVIAEEVDAPAP